MKLRIRDNSLRLRLSRSEVEQLAVDGSVSARIRFPGGSELSYEVEGSPACVAPTAVLEAERISVRLPASVVETWAGTDQVSISDVQKLSTGESLTILVEKDFACLSPRDGEDDSDMFEHPDAGKATC